MSNTAVELNNAFKAIVPDDVWAIRVVDTVRMTKEDMVIPKSDPTGEEEMLLALFVLSTSLPLEYLVLTNLV